MTPSLAVDDNGKVHLAFERTGTGIYYGTNKSGSWVTTQLSTDWDVTPSLDVDGTGKVHLAFDRLAADDGGIHYVRR